MHCCYKDLCDDKQIYSVVKIRMVEGEIDHFCRYTGQVGHVGRLFDIQSEQGFLYTSVHLETLMPQDGSWVCQLERVPEVVLVEIPEVSDGELLQAATGLMDPDDDTEMLDQDTEAEIQSKRRKTRNDNRVQLEHKRKDSADNKDLTVEVIKCADSEWNALLLQGSL